MRNVVTEEARRANTSSFAFARSTKGPIHMHPEMRGDTETKRSRGGLNQDYPIVQNELPFAKRIIHSFLPKAVINEYGGYDRFEVDSSYYEF